MRPSRAEEYELKIAGASYEEIARKGGGILNSVNKLARGHKRGFEENARMRRSNNSRRTARRRLRQRAGTGSTLRAN